MTLLRKLWRLLTGGFSIGKLRMTPGRLRFWWWRTPGRNADIDKKL